ncbi:hypothetical protein [Streptomyces antibioticus]|uniref:hypothetical protein n=1 Tax=Streptomyces antibioticus TaxID=1890 RepID=UPI0034054691
MRGRKMRSVAVAVATAGGLVSMACGEAFANGPGGSGAEVTGGSAATSVTQETVAQSGRQNTDCANLRDDLTLTDSRARTRCVTGDVSFNKDVVSSTGGARVESGSDTFSLEQRSVAQSGRQNTTCGNTGPASTLELDEGRWQVDCTNLDGSSTVHSRVSHGGAKTTSGSGSRLRNHDSAQAGRQNNACANTSGSADPQVLGGSVSRVDCANLDRSVTAHSLEEDRGARAASGTAAGGDNQNISQAGRQNNACAAHDFSDLVLETGSTGLVDCANVDRSVSGHTRVTGGGAEAVGGSAITEQQNIAQSGGQNNACDELNDGDPFLDEGSLRSVECVNDDKSVNHRTRVHKGHARAVAGSGGSSLSEQTVAQSGRQNNACANLNESDPDIGDAGREQTRCGNLDRSVSKHTRVRGGNADIAGGGASATSTLEQQNIAQAGRQNNACSNQNSTESLDVTGGTVRGDCKTVDGSRNTGTTEIHGDAQIEGGSSTGGDLIQQNIAQAGRQNNACDNHNELDAELTGSRQKTGCVTVDRSVNAGTTHVGGDAHVEGGSGAASVFQQNIAQSGRQNNACGNTNALSLTATGGSRTASQCVAVDRSVNIEPKGH